MNIKKCDRCQKEINTVSYKTWLHTCYAKNTITLFWKNERRDIIEIDYDLCDKCRDDFDVWMEGKKTNGGKDDG